MTTKFLAEGEVLNHVASGAKTVGQVVLIGDRIGIALAAIADGATGALAVEGVFTIDKTTPEVYAQGDQLYWVAGTSKVSSTAGSNKKAGIAAAAALSAATTCAVKINA